MNSYELVADWVSEQHHRRKHNPDYSLRQYEEALWEFTSKLNDRVLYEDTDIAVINKPPYILSHSSSYDDESFGVDEIGKFMWGDRTEVAHRLDRNTSGAIILAKNPDSLFNLHAQFARRSKVPIEKHYLAFLEGEVTEDKKIDALLSYQGQYGFVIPDESQSDATTRTSETVIQPIKTYGDNGNSYTAALIQIMTGRSHQIRIITSHLGHPVIGDSLYGGKKNHTAPRQLLHAWNIKFTHPTTNEPMDIQAPIPEDMMEWMGN